jgi:hypothetical protein
MENEFIPYAEALALKELGFDEPCFNYYGKNNKLPHQLDCMFGYRAHFNKNFVLAPLYQQAFRWFREEYDLVHTVYSNASGYIWELHYNQERGGTHICDSGESGDCEMSGMFTTYEKAELECLKKLIKIIKNGR